MFHAALLPLLGAAVITVQAEVSLKFGSISEHGRDIVDTARERGHFTITGLPIEFLTARAHLSHALVNDCNESVFGFSDETKRTLALYAGEASQVPSCLSMPDVRSVDELMRTVTHSLARLLDETLFLGVTDTAVTLEGGQRLSTVSEIVSVDGGRHHLDHWNVYSVPEDATASRGVQVEMHADMGLFLLLSLPPGDRSLQFEEGVVSIPDDGDALVVIFGEALKSWMASTVDIMAARHRVAIPVSNGSQPRVVFGRMMMAPPTALNSAGVSYQQFFMAPQAFQSRRMLSQCAAGQVYCWLRCMTPPEGCPAENAVCWDFRKMDLCDMTPGKMQPDCALRCPAGIVTAGEFAKDEPFCEGSTDMVMSGLQFLWSRNRHCIILFFPFIVLDSPLKFFLGMIAVFCIGVLAEGALRLRKGVENALGPRRSSARGKLILIVLFSINLILAYMAMLVAMTYSGELFLTVILGVAVGRILPTSDEPTGYSHHGTLVLRIDEADPCCAAISSNDMDPPLMVEPAGSRRRLSGPDEGVHQYLVAGSDSEVSAARNILQRKRLEP